MDISYDIEEIVKFSKRKLGKSIALLSLYAVLFMASALTVVFYGGYLPMFIAAIVSALFFTFLYKRQFNKTVFSDFKSSRGYATKIHKDVKTVRGIVGGINPFGARMYDSYRKNEIRLDIFIDDNGEIDCYHIAGITDKHVEYYENKGRMLHIFGAHFPVREDIDGEEWLCPICGEFNSVCDRTCSGCKNKILKDK